MIRNILIVGCLALTACAGTTDIIDRRLETVQVPTSFYQCDIASLPDPNKLTDLQLARLIKTLYKDNQQCKASLDAIHNYLNIADDTVGVPPSQLRKLYNSYMGRNQ